MGIEIQIPFRAFHRAACSLTDTGRPMPIQHDYFCSQFNIIDVENGIDGDFMVKFNTEHDAMMFLLKWS